MKNISEKANLILQIILLALGLILLRIWHVSVIQGDKIREEARKPQQKMILEPAIRGSIRDRFNIPLAVNKIHYQAALLYSQVSDVPSITWEIDPVSEKKIKKYKRKEHIKQLSQLLAQELDMDAERIEDLIYSKAALYHQRPFIIKDNITETQYYRLKLLEKDWAGLQAICTSRRYYPHGRIGADIIGYMGAIDRKNYESIIGEMQSLQTYLKEWELGNDPILPEKIHSTKEVRNRLKDLQDKAYSLNDYVGKGGVEGKYEQLLRGFHGQKIYSSNAQGDLLKQLPGERPAIPGQRVILSLSIELQEYAEKLLAQNEPIRDGRSADVDRTTGERTLLKQPWIKGGAIVVMDPVNGEIITMASYPRYDPNDFISTSDPEINRLKQAGVRRWFEQESYIAEVWDQKRPFEKEVFKNNIFKDEGDILTWEQYLHRILPFDNEVCKAFEKNGKIETAISLQKKIEESLAIAGLSGNSGDLFVLFNHIYSQDPHQRYGKQIPLYFTAKEKESIHRNLDQYFDPIKNNYNKVLMTDLCRVAVDADLFSPQLVNDVGDRSVATYRAESSAFSVIDELIKNMARDLFHDLHFKVWREKNGKSFLKQKRAEEKAQQRYARPYLDYLDKEESEQFQAFWKEERWLFIQAFLMPETISETIPETLKPYIDHFSAWSLELSQGAHKSVLWYRQYGIVKAALQGLNTQIAMEYLQTMRSYNDLNRPLWGRYGHLRSEKKQQIEKNLAAAFYPIYGYGYARSFAFRQATTQGSIFKIVTAYEGLKQYYQDLLKQNCEMYTELNPLEINDHVQKSGASCQVGTYLDGKPIPRLYKGGLLPRSLKNNLGRLNIVKAIEVSSNPYFALLAGEYLNDPEDLVDAARQFSYGARTGIDLPGELGGFLPNDVSYNRTGLYSFAIGQHKLIATPLQTAVMLSTIANDGMVIRPHVVKLIAGNEPIRSDGEITEKERFPYQDGLAAVGIDFSLFSLAEKRENTSQVHQVKTDIMREIYLPKKVREPILKGMHRSALSSQTSSGGSLSVVYKDYPNAVQDLVNLKDQLIGKSSTSEVVETIDLDIDKGTNMYNHIWFGGISFNKENLSTTFVSKDLWGKPELVVVVYLRFGGYGKEAAPLAAQIVKKWREIKEKQAS